MNNFQNNSRKFVRSTKTLTDYEGAQETFQKKQRDESKTRENLVKSKPTEALKIFFESEVLSRKEPGFEWSLNYIKNKTSQKDCSNVIAKSGKAKKGNKKQPGLRKKSDWDALEVKIKNELEVKKILKTDEKPGVDKLVSKKETVKNHEVTPQSNEKRGTKKSKENFNNIPKPQKEKQDLGKTRPQAEVSIRSLASVLSANVHLQTSFQKFPGKVSQIIKPIEVIATPSETRKNHINEILKGHAQKVQTNPAKSCQQIKDYSFQGVSEFTHNSSKADKNKKENHSSKHEINAEKGVDVYCTEKVETGSKTIKEVDDILKEAIFSSNEEKKTVAWMKYPQSNELGRRLKNLWQEPGSLFPQDKGKFEEVCEEDENEEDLKEKSLEKVKEEKKEEKKMTYTDRLLLSRTLGKEKTDNKLETEKSMSAEYKKDENFEKKLDAIDKLANLSKKMSITKEITMPDTKEIVTIKESRQNEGEQIFKTKSTRSTELRDLVTQAVKEHKIFCIFDNHWYIVRPVREELLSRGWLEVIPDRRLIPRRRPPPVGPTYDREKMNVDLTIEAILSAKETFADEIRETVSKSSSFRTTVEKPKLLSIPAPNLTKKCSDDSITEVFSQFRIIPPTAEKKKNNFEIREFVTKCQSMLENEKEKDKKGKEKEKEKGKTCKKEKNKTSESPQKNKPGENVNESANVEATTAALSKSLQAILDAINDNKKAILNATGSTKHKELKPGAFGLLCNSTAKNLPSIEAKETQEKPEKTNGSECNSKISFNESDAKLISKIIQSMNAKIHFMWLSIKPGIHLKCFSYSPEIVNKFQKTTFCTKIGLWSHLNNIQWYAHEVHFPAKSPRMYNTGEADDLQAFYQDFQMTACIGMLKWLSDTFFEKGIKAVQTKKGKVPLKAFEFAIKQCERYVRFKDNEDLGVIDEPRVLQEEWNTFLQWFYIITNDHGKIQESSSAQLMVVYTKAVDTLRTMKKHWPEIDIDGRLNIWIMKPYCASCGRGIFMTNNVYYISQHSKYIVQKYIERPLLIYNTKFDIRQWFMVTKLTPLEIWMYKECYLRFCTQPFALRNLHESVHLSNNSVQRKYISIRDPGLPDQNMWDSNTFQLYLKTIGHPTIWQDIIYPGMRDAIVSTMLAAQDTFDGPRRSWFEVYGADFMISANLKDGPWLIEINENPAMDPSTKVTARLCPQMLRDVIKVVVDKRSNKNASTGQWELVYRQNYSPSFGTVDIDVRGKKIARVPHNVKVGLSPQNPVSPIHGKKSGTEGLDSNKLYEVIKELGSKQNNKGGTNDNTRPEKAPKLIKMGDKDPQKKIVEKSVQSTIKLIKNKPCSNLQILTEDKLFSKQNDKKAEVYGQENTKRTEKT